MKVSKNVIMRNQSQMNQIKGTNLSKMYKLYKLNDLN